MGDWQPFVAFIPGFEKFAGWYTLPHTAVGKTSFLGHVQFLLTNFMTPVDVQLVTVLLNFL